MDPLVIISSDGHATAVMADYRPYLEERFHEEFDAFVLEWEDHGSRNFDPPALARRMDPADVDEWTAKVVDTGRLDGNTDPRRRLEEMDREGFVAEVLFPDFGKPFELYPPALASALGHPPLDFEHIQAGNRAFNRWLADFITVAPERFAAMAAISWDDTDAAVAEVGAARRLGFRGIVLPAFDPMFPLFHECHEPIWNEIVEQGLVVNSHLAISSTSNRPIYTPGVPHPGCSIRVRNPELDFYCHNILSHLIWGGVFERHPELQVVFTEQGSSWVVHMLHNMDYSYEGSYFRSDYKSVIRSKPSEYFARHCYLGSSIFSRAEVEARHEIGLDKMMMGMDYPHHEGTLINGTEEYLQATFGLAGVPVDEARRMLGETAASVFGFDLDVLRPLAERAGVTPERMLAAPAHRVAGRGDIDKPTFF